MSKEITYTDVQSQIEKLKSQRLIISDEEKASELLTLFGYSNLIKSYRTPYVYKVDGQLFYRSGVSFGQICSLYVFDRSIRNAVMSSMQDLEEHIKTAAADVIGYYYGVHTEDYLNYRNYVNKKKRKQQFTLPGILDKLKKTLDTDKEPIHHYVVEYGYVPPWILFKSIYFTTIVNYIDLFKHEQQVSMVHHLYDTNSIHLSDDALVKLMMDTLYICIDYRNTAAHGGRIYDFTSPARLRTEEIFGKPFSLSGLNRLLFLLSNLAYERPYNQLHRVLEEQINRHCTQYPEDITYLTQILNVDVSQKKIVWACKNSNKYHTYKYCSGINDAFELSLSEAKAANMIPCKRCIR